MLFQLKRILLFFCILTSLSSCSYYISGTTLPTAFTEKNEKSISASASLQGVFANLAYTPVQHLYVVGQGTLSRQSSHFSGGLGTYYSLSEKFSVELNSQFGWGRFNWGDPFNGLSEPSQINSANGSLNQLNNLFSMNFHFEKGSKLSVAFVHRYLDVSFDRTNWDRFSINGKVNSTQINLVGIHLICRKKMGSKFNFIGAVGVEGKGESYNYTHNPLFLRLGFEFR